MPRRNCFSRESLPQSPFANRTRRRMPEIEVRPSTPENQIKHTEEHLPAEETSVVQETVETEEIQPRKSREDKVLEVLESGEFIHKISPQVRRKFVAPSGSKL